MLVVANAITIHCMSIQIILDHYKTNVEC